MKNLFCKLLIITLFLASCAKDNYYDGAIQQDMKTVSVAAEMDLTGTKATLDSETGAFAWQSGDMISVLATDGKFYDFILDGESGSDKCEFVGQIPASESITTLATYPRIVANGSVNNVYADGVLNFVLPSEWSYAKEVSNVPMVASFGEGAEYLSFKQVGGVMRFPVKNFPANAKFVVKMKGKGITGKFPVDITALGTSAMQAAEGDSELVINYSSDVDGASVEFNVPVPVGVYNEFSVVVKDASDAVVFTKDYKKTDDVADNVVNRATLMVMKDIVMPERPIVISEVWPFFADARVVFNKYDGVSQYAYYIDGADEPVIVDAENFNNKAAGLIGGNFALNTTHTVAVAKVVDGTPVVASKSETATFTTANIFQLSQNTGTKFVSVGWDDVALGWGPKYVDGKWTAVSKALNPDNVSVHYKRGYQVQLLAADKTTVVYDLIPFAGHEAFTGLFSDSSWLGQVDGQNILIPTALAFGYLEPGKDYYVRVKTLDGVEEIGVSEGNCNPEDGGNYPYPYPIYSERGGSAWSELVKVSTDAPHSGSVNEILYEGFDDMMVANDYVNWAPAVVPDVQNERIDWTTYCEVNMKNTYPAFLNLPSSERKWTAQAFSKTIRAEYLGMLDGSWVSEVPRTFNDNAGSLKGWTVVSKDKEARTVYPHFGSVWIGQSGSGTDGSTKLITPAINSEKLLNNTATKCIVTVNIAYAATTQNVVPLQMYVGKYRNDELIGEEIGLSVQNIYPAEYKSMVENNHIATNNYAHHQRFYEVSCEVYLKKGDKLSFRRPNGLSAGKGMLILGDIKIEVVPGEYEAASTFVDNGVGTEPDNTNYDVYGLGEFPVSFWWAPPTRQHNYDDTKTRELYRDMAASGINVVNYVGELDYSVAENIRIMNIAADYGMKFIGCAQADAEHPYGFSSNAERIAAVKEHLASSPTYVGEHLRDEPSASAFDELGQFTREYLAELPDEEVYINLFPIYAKASALGTTTYERHLDEYLDKVPTKSLSYDYYGLGKVGGNLGTDYYTNLDMVRAKTLEKKMPFWVITQAGIVGNNRQPSEVEQRWTVWSTIAGGSKGIAYFCYWTPTGSDFSTTYYMLTNDGQKTENYDYISRINADINTVGKKLLPCHSDGLILTAPKYYPLFVNDAKGRTNYGPVKSVTGSTSVACGCFRDARTEMNGENYKGYKVLVVSQMPNRDVDATLAIDPSVTAITFTHNNTTEAVQLYEGLSVSVGSINIKKQGNNLVLSIPSGEAALLEF